MKLINLSIFLSIISLSYSCVCDKQSYRQLLRCGSGRCEIPALKTSFCDSDFTMSVYVISVKPNDFGFKDLPESRYRVNIFDVYKMRNGIDKILKKIDVSLFTPISCRRDLNPLSIYIITGRVIVDENGLRLSTSSCDYARNYASLTFEELSFFSGEFRRMECPKEEVKFNILKVPRKNDTFNQNREADKHPTDAPTTIRPNTILPTTILPTTNAPTTIKVDNISVIANENTTPISEASLTINIETTPSPKGDHSIPIESNINEILSNSVNNNESVINVLTSNNTKNGINEILSSSTNNSESNISNILITSSNNIESGINEILSSPSKYNESGAKEVEAISSAPVGSANVDNPTNEILNNGMESVNISSEVNKPAISSGNGISIESDNSLVINDANTNGLVEI